MSKKPEWSVMMQRANDMYRQSEELRNRAVSARCDVTTLGGARCTADAAPDHSHRYWIEDLP